MLLYHGSKSGIQGDIKPDYFRNRNTCDFGKGFYLGDLPDQPKGLIVGRPQGRFYEIEYDSSNLKVKDFSAVDDYTTKIDWALFIAYNRIPEYFNGYPFLQERYHSYNTSYDLIIGLIADDSMMMVLDEFFSGKGSDKYLIDCLRHVKLGKQYVLKTEEACKKERMQILVDRPLSAKEIKSATAENANRKAQMDSVIGNYSRKYRRDQEAKYIDEIMEEWNTSWKLQDEM